MARLTHPLRSVAIALVVAGLAVQQIASMALLSRYASAPALPLLIPGGVGYALYGALDRSPIPAVLGAPLRTTLARRLLADGRAAEARDVISRLPPGADRSDLEGMSAVASGNLDLAADDFVEAGDDQRLAQIVDIYEKTNLQRAITVQQRLTTRLDRPPIPAPGLADAYWRLGVLQATLGYVGKPAERHTANEAAAVSYEQAVALAPFSVKYLLALANQQANTGDRAGSIATFRRLLDLDPHSNEARDGLARLGMTSPDR